MFPSIAKHTAIQLFYKTDVIPDGVQKICSTCDIHKYEAEGDMIYYEVGTFSSS